MKKKMIVIISILVIVWIGISFFGGVFTKKGGDISNKVITGHRGGASLGMENSLECIANSIALGTKSIEIDVHITLDGEIVVCHDPTVDRTTKGKGSINDMTLSQIKKLKLISQNGEPTNQTIPTLEEVLKLLNGKVELLLEIKRKRGNNKNIEGVVLNVLKKHNAFSYTIIQSFDDSVLETLHSLEPTLRLEKLLFGKFWGIPIIFDGTFSIFSFKKYNYIKSFNFYHNALLPSLSVDLHNKGYRTRIWTLDNPEYIPQIMLDGIITDSPNLFVE